MPSMRRTDPDLRMVPPKHHLNIILSGSRETDVPVPRGPAPDDRIATVAQEPNRGDLRLLDMGSDVGANGVASAIATIATIATIAS